MNVYLLPLLFIPVILYIWSGVLAYQDGLRRGKSPWLIAFLVLFAGWPVTLLLWIAFRPDQTHPPFDLERFRVQ